MGEECDKICILGNLLGLQYGEDGPEEGEAGIRRAARPYPGSDGYGAVG